MKKKAEIKALLFDLGNVLINYDIVKVAREYARHCGISWIKVWFHFIASPWEKLYSCGKISSYEFFRHAKEISPKPIRYKLFRAVWNDIFWENKGMDELLAKLKRRYSLYLVSNTNAMHFRYLKKKFKVFRHFDKTFASHDVGSRKPDRAYYRHVLKTIKLRPEEVVFIDDMTAFIRGAKKAGMNTIRFRKKAQLIRDLGKLGVKI